MAASSDQSVAGAGIVSTNGCAVSCTVCPASASSMTRIRRPSMQVPAMTAT